MHLVYSIVISQERNFHLQHRHDAFMLYIYLNAVINDNLMGSVHIDLIRISLRLHQILTPVPSYCSRNLVSNLHSNSNYILNIGEILYIMINDNIPSKSSRLRIFQGLFALEFCHVRSLVTDTST